MISDPIFYRLFESSPETFFLLLALPADAAKEMAARYQYQAIEFKETSHRTDGIFLPREPGLPIYFLEVQFYALSSVFADLKGKGLLIEQLNENARKVARSLLEQRLAVLSPMARKVLDKAIQHDGGVDKVRLRLDGDASKSIDEGGRYSWNLTSPSFACDWKSDGKSHPHMTLTAKRSE